jgi:hypothetical protein
MLSFNKREISVGCSLILLGSVVCPLAMGRTGLFDLHAKTGSGLTATATRSSGLAPIPLVENGVNVLRQPCRFSDGAARAGWDYPVRLDLRSGMGIQFSVRCSNVRPISYFACYLKSGADGTGVSSR